MDRSELSVASVADATGYSKTSWERYLNGRLLAPKGAIVALAEVTETNPVHLTTMGAGRARLEPLGDAPRHDHGGHPDLPGPCGPR
ncbi:helix-turn-helix domain-containing protein [Streptomyces lividans]